MSDSPQHPGNPGNPQHADCGADAAAFVLGALEREEADAFRAHLETCAVCRDEVEAYRAVVDALPLAAPPYPAPRSLKRRVMGEVRAGERSTAAGARRQLGPPSWWRMLPRPALAMATAAAVAVAVVVLIGVALVDSGHGTRLIHASTSWPAASAELRVSGSHGELVVQRMPAPPSGKVYEVWVARPGKPPAPTNTLFSVTASGAASVDVPGSLRGVQQVMVTPEPAGGSKVPTHPPVLVARLA